MVFSSELFLFIFLPATLLGCLILRRHLKLKNTWLLAVSLAFYAYGSHEIVLLLLFSVFINWAIALLITKNREAKVKKLLLATDIIINLGYLFYFKYYNFFRENVAALTGGASDFERIVLPIGISFFTFQALSYCIDVYRDHTLVQKNIFNVALYIAFFPQLIAGPIVRFKTISEEIKRRHVTWEDLSEGSTRFVYGLGKKVLIANLMGIMADELYAMEPSKLSVGAAWIASIAYTFQIYFDFSGYSDMAIGLGRMFGFHFLENFDFPYISRTVTEFWRRWHISLGSWFRDYIYIPLGGNRKGKGRQIINLEVVWLMTGIWHGANWTFILWGVFYGILIILEKLTGLDRKMPAVIGNVYTMFTVNTLWVLFRSDNLTAASGMLQTMFGFTGAPLWDDNAAFYLAENYTLFIAAFVLSLPLIKSMKKLNAVRTIFDLARPFIVASILLFSVSFMVKGAYNPFIYFNF